MSIKIAISRGSVLSGAVWSCSQPTWQPARRNASGKLLRRTRHWRSRVRRRRPGGRKSSTPSFRGRSRHKARPHAPPSELGEGYTARSIQSGTFAAHVKAIEVSPSPPSPPPPTHPPPTLVVYCLGGFVCRDSEEKFFCVLSSIFGLMKHRGWCVRTINFQKSSPTH